MSQRFCLSRKLLVWSAFIVGSMAPDFPYILGTVAPRSATECRDCCCSRCLRFAALWLFHNVIKRPVVGLFPVAVQAKLRDQWARFALAGLRRFFAIFLAIVLGIASHLIWDGFSHSRSWFWYTFPGCGAACHFPMRVLYP